MQLERVGYLEQMGFECGFKQRKEVHIPDV